MAEKDLVGRIAFHHNHLKRITAMNKKNFFTPLYLVIFVLFATLVGCSSKDERSEQVIERKSSTTTTVERPVTQEKKTTTTTTESR
jgi:hypothetical protein